MCWKESICVSQGSRSPGKESSPFFEAHVIILYLSLKSVSVKKGRQPLNSQANAFSIAKIVDFLPKTKSWRLICAMQLATWKT